MENERTIRRGLVRVALWITADTPHAPNVVERKLLAQFLRGVITIDQLLGLVEDRIQTEQAVAGLKQLIARATPKEA